MRDTALRLVIFGRVQKVGYRAWVMANAGRYGLRGWVRNRSDGSVEAVFQGAESKINDMIEACKEGSPEARVERIETYSWKEELPDEPFMAKPTV